MKKKDILSFFMRREQREVEGLAEFIESAYRAVLRRDPDPDGKQRYLERMRQGMSYRDLLDELARSKEYRLKRVIDLGAHEKFSVNTVGSGVSGLGHRIAATNCFDRRKYEEIWSEYFTGDRILIVGQREYGCHHKERFWELFNTLAVLIEGREFPCVLEFGASTFSAFYKRLFPQLEFHLCDRPVPEEYIGFTESVARRLSQCDDYFEVDLERPYEIEEKIVTPGNSYDVVIFTEVLEHLLVHPVELFKQLGQLLRQKGFIYLTTPNFFSRANMTRLQNLENPSPMYPPSGGNWDAHYHFREYSLKELLELVQQARLNVESWYFSDCWDTDVTKLAECERGNLVLLIGMS